MSFIVSCLEDYPCFDGCRSNGQYSLLNGEIVRFCVDAIHVHCSGIVVAL